MYRLGGPPPENVCIFELRRLDFLQFQLDFRSCKKGLLIEGNGQQRLIKYILGGENPSVGGGGGAIQGLEGGGAGFRGGSDWCRLHLLIIRLISS